MKYSR